MSSTIDMSMLRLRSEAFDPLAEGLLLGAAARFLSSSLCGFASLQVL